MIRVNLGRVSYSIVLDKYSGSPPSWYNGLRCVVSTVAIYILSEIKNVSYIRKRKRKKERVHE